MKYDNRLANKVIEKEEFEQQQKRLRKKYDVEEEGIIRIEKKRSSSSNSRSCEKNMMWKRRELSG